MKIPFSIYVVMSKMMKYIGDHIVPIAITTAAGGLAITGKFTYDKLEKENTKYEYKGWIVYRQGEFVYAKKGKESIVKKTSEFDDLEKMIDAAD